MSGQSERHAGVCDGLLSPRKPEDCFETIAAEVASCWGDAGGKGPTKSSAMDMNQMVGDTKFL